MVWDVLRPPSPCGGHNQHKSARNRTSEACQEVEGRRGIHLSLRTCTMRTISLFVIKTLLKPLHKIIAYMQAKKP